MEKGIINKIKRVGGHASYLKIPPELPGWLIVTLETQPVAERIQTDRGPLWENDAILLTISCKWKCKLYVRQIE